MEDKLADAQMDEDPLKVVRSLIKMIGDDPDREGVVDTPDRVVRSWSEIFGGYKMDPSEVLKTTFDAEGYNQMIICKDIEMFSTCEHHMIPFFGVVHIGYVPGDRVVGLSKLARLVEVFSRRLQIQERLTKQIHESLVTALRPRGAMVVIESKHLCMCARGVAKQNSLMVTSAFNNVFEDAKARAEFMGLIK